MYIQLMVDESWVLLKYLWEYLASATIFNIKLQTKFILLSIKKKIFLKYLLKLLRFQEYPLKEIVNAKSLVVNTIIQITKKFDHMDIKRNLSTGKSYWEINY